MIHNADVCEKAGDHEFVNTGGISADTRGWTAKTANIGAANRQNSLLHIHFLCWKIRSRIKRLLVLIFSSDTAMDQRSGDGRFVGQIKILAIGCWKEFSKLYNVRREDGFCLE